MKSLSIETQWRSCGLSMYAGTTVWMIPGLRRSWSLHWQTLFVRYVPLCRFIWSRAAFRQIVGYLVLKLTKFIQVKGYNGFDAEAYWQLQSVASGLGQLLKDWRLKEQQDDQKKSVEQATAKKNKGSSSIGISMNSNSNQECPPTVGALSEQCVTQSHHQVAYTPVPVYSPYVHPGILRRKIDESYDFDEEDDDTEMA